MPTSLLLDLPVELASRVLFETDVISLLRCRETCKLFNQTITESALLQYKIDLFANGMIDGPPGIDGMHTATSRLAALRVHCQAWDTLQPRKKTVIPGRIKDNSLYELWGGVWARASKAAGRPLVAVQLPSIVRGIEMKTWRTPLANSAKLADFGMDPHQDLLVLILSNKDSTEYHVDLLSLREGSRHPRAKKTTLNPEFRTNPNMFTRYTFTVQILGNLLGLLCEVDLRSYTMFTLLVIWDWTTGRTIMRREGPVETRLLNSFAFISEKLFFVASSCLIYGLDSDSDQEAPSLDIYLLDDDGGVRNIRSLYFPEIECDAAEDGRICIRHLTIRSDPAPTVIADSEHPYPFLVDPRQRLYIVTMILEYEGDIGFAFNTLHFLIPSSTFLGNIPTCYGGEEVGRGLDEDLSWDEWGPAGTKLHSRDELPSNYVCYVYGMKFVVVPSSIPNLEVPQGDDRQGPRRKVTVYDFSPVAVRREKAGLNPHASHPGIEVDVLEGQSHPEPAFNGGRVEGSLRCVRRRTTLGHSFVSAMMDADNIILVKPGGVLLDDNDMEIWTM